MPPPEVAIVPGFISSSYDNNEITNLGRGGSDYTAAIIAAAMDASMLEIWTDVDGFMTADPKIINSAYVIEELSFTEAIELSNFGAKVIYPPTIFLFITKYSYLRQNTFRPESEGTLIRNILPTRNGKIIKGISSINDTALITIQGLGMVGVIGVNKRIFSALADNGISVFIVSQASSENSTSIGVRSQDAPLSQKVLSKEFAHEIMMGSINEIIVEYDLATIAIVGQNMKHVPGIAANFRSTGRNGISIVALAQGAGETNITCVISRSDLKKSLNVIHDSFFLSPYQELNLFVIGTGTVGGKLLEQIRQQQNTLKEQNKLRINIVGIANGRKALFTREGIPLEGYFDNLMSNGGVKSTPERIRDEILKMNIFNSVFVDCTASPAITDLYNDLIARNISVVTANKIAASSDYENYRNLKETARKAGVKFLFETNVGAGLPIINTMNSLINSGDKIVKLEAVLSGTLNFIFNTISEEIPFSKAIKMAVEEQFAEPDPPNRPEWT